MSLACARAQAASDDDAVRHRRDASKRRIKRCDRAPSQTRKLARDRETRPLLGRIDGPAKTVSAGCASAISCRGARSSLDRLRRCQQITRRTRSSRRSSRAALNAHGARNGARNGPARAGPLSNTACASSAERARFPRDHYCRRGPREIRAAMILILFFGTVLL
jgi:hypothetical protein